MDLQPIDYEVAGNAFTGFLADGSGGRKAPGILVVHEGGGLTGHAKERARMLAGLGYVAFAMDLYGEHAPPMERARPYLVALRKDPVELHARATAALGVLQGNAYVDPGRLAAVGFCFGGTTVLELARIGAEVRAVVGFHAGLTPLQPDRTPTIAAKVLVCQGADDPIITLEQRNAFEAEMTAAGADWRMLVLGGVAHSFTNPEIDALAMPGFAYDERADRRTWAVMRNFLDEALA